MLREIRWLQENITTCADGVGAGKIHYRYPTDIPYSELHRSLARLRYRGAIRGTTSRVTLWSVT